MQKINNIFTTVCIKIKLFNKQLDKCNKIKNKIKKSVNFITHQDQSILGSWKYHQQQYQPTFPYLFWLQTLNSIWNQRKNS